jgi:hypothetical protein
LVRHKGFGFNSACFNRRGWLDDEPRLFAACRGEFMTGAQLYITRNYMHLERMVAPMSPNPMLRAAMPRTDKEIIIFQRVCRGEKSILIGIRIMPTTEYSRHRLPWSVGDGGRLYVSVSWHGRYTPQSDHLVRRREKSQWAKSDQMLRCPRNDAMGQDRTKCTAAKIELFDHLVGQQLH